MGKLYKSLAAEEEVKSKHSWNIVKCLTYELVVKYHLDRIQICQTDEDEQFTLDEQHSQTILTKIDKVIKEACKIPKEEVEENTKKLIVLLYNDALQL